MTNAGGGHESGDDEVPGANGSRAFGHLAAVWAVTFAAAHVFWALGGSVGLDISAGQELATERPGWFVSGGLWGVAVLCLVGALVGVGLSRRGVHGVRWRLLNLLGWGVAALLLVRGIGVELLIIAGVYDLGDSVSAAQRFWTLALWNPWFVLGGVLFGLAAHNLRKDMAVPAGVPSAAIH